MSTDTDFQNGADNLLANCAGMGAGDRLLLVTEPETENYYETELAIRLADHARARGAEATIMEAPFDPEASELPTDLSEAMDKTDQTIFLARIGDQIRFSDIGKQHRAVVSYALSSQLLSSPFGTADYAPFVTLKQAIDGLLAASGSVEVTCPNGTHFTGEVPTGHETGKEVSILRFPMLVFTPVEASGFSGKAALPGFLVGTGSKYYTPYGQAFAGPLLACFESGRLTGFEGSRDDIRLAEDHYRYVADKYGIDADFIHSWHAGIHPGCHYDRSYEDSPERWSGAAFGNPRILHFHTCGAYAPGEISWNIIDPTVRVDGVAIWENGRLHPERFAAGRELLEAEPSLRHVFENPAREIGL